MGTRAGEQSHIGARGAQLATPDAVAAATARSKEQGARAARGEEGRVCMIYCGCYYYQLPHLFSCPLAFFLDLHQTALLLLLSPYPTTLSLSPITFQPSLLFARYFLSPTRETRPTHSLRRISYSSTSSN